VRLEAKEEKIHLTFSYPPLSTAIAFLSTAIVFSTKVVAKACSFLAKEGCQKPSNSAKTPSLFSRMPARARAQLLPEAEGLEGRGEAKQLPLLWKSIPIFHREGSG